MKKIFIFSFLFQLISSILHPSSISTLIPDSTGWKLSEPPKLFTPEKLYEHINGAAEAYFSFGFKELLVAYFWKDNSSLTLEIYNMGNPMNAFGIYSIERSPFYEFIEIGNHGYTDGENLFFIIGSYYIKILCNECGENSLPEILSFAKGITEKVQAKGSLPETLKYFPENGLIKNSEKFFPKNFLGIDFLKNGFQADYEIEGRRFSIFIIEEFKEDEAEKTYIGLISTLEKRKGVEKLYINSMEGRIAEDMVYGRIAIVRNGKFIIGYLGSEEASRVRNYLLEVIKRIGGSK
ncbi:MAG: DUF6599 family protein [Candidatus Aminicenantia bacterium]